MGHAGADIVACDIRPDTLSAVTDEILAIGRRCLPAQVDVSDRSAADAMFDEAADHSLYQLIPVGRLGTPAE